jgi:NAD(P)-dependent dehydrogenase (short-subunit alcohol dehydrogenase family)
MAERGIFDLSGKVALVTGGGSGIGRAYCQAMAEFGADVACSDIVEQAAQETVRLIGKYGHRAIAIKADASKQDEINHMVIRTVEELGTIDIVFANAGIGDQSLVKLHEESVEDWDRVMALQPRGTFLLMKAVFPIMMKKKSGSFISTASIGGLTTTAAGGFFQLLTAYCSAKGAVVMLTKIAAKQYGEYGIRVNAICPGVQLTSMVTEEMKPLVESIIVPLTPLGRLGKPEELKGLAIWLASDASSFVTGQTFVQDGGMIA